jgi:predicted kinase
MTNKPLGELVILRGLPGSGKTTHAETLAFLDGGRVVGRDHIRALTGIKNGVGSRKQEDEISKVQDQLITAGLLSGQNVYVDDINLKAAYVKRLIRLAVHLGASWSIEDLTYIPLTECLRRNAARSRVVPSDVIRSYHKRFIEGKGFPLPVPDGVFDPKLAPVKPYMPDETKPSVVLIDIDGTVALMNGRKPHDYDRVSEDLPNIPVIHVVRSVISQGLHPVFLSGRPDSCEEATGFWINKHVYSGPRHLLMRRTGDFRADFEVKMELFDQHIRDTFNVRYALDDRNQVVDMYRAMGITVLQVAPGNF